MIVPAPGWPKALGKAGPQAYFSPARYDPTCTDPRGRSYCVSAQYGFK